MTRLRLALLFLSVLPSFRRLSAQSHVDGLALRFSSMTAVTGLEQAMGDSLFALLPGSTRDRAGNITLTLGQGAPKRLLTCPLDEVGYVVGNILPDGYLLLRRVGGGGGGGGGGARASHIHCSISSSRASASRCSAPAAPCPAWSR